jgi:predicted DNA-binding protein YlxM (UPF0122 family)
VLSIALGSFVLSYNALREVALTNGFPSNLSYIWPLLIDASLVVFSLATVNAYLQIESVWKQWTLVGIYTVATTTFNVLHAPQNFQAQIVAAIAPMSLFFSFELLMSQLKNSVSRQGVIDSITQLAQKLESMTQSAQNLTEEIVRLTNRQEALKTELKELLAEKKEIIRANGSQNQNNLDLANQSKRAQILTRQAKVSEFLEIDMNPTQIAEQLEVSLATVKRDIRTINTNGTN